MILYGKGITTHIKAEGIVINTMHFYFAEETKVIMCLLCIWMLIQINNKYPLQTYKNRFVNLLTEYCYLS